MVADTHHFDDPDTSFHFHADLDPTFQFSADPDPAPHQSAANLRTLIYKPSTDLPSILSLHANILSVHGPPWLPF